MSFRVRQSGSNVSLRHASLQESRINGWQLPTSTPPTLDVCHEPFDVAPRLSHPRLVASPGPPSFEVISIISAGHRKRHSLFKYLAVPAVRLYSDDRAFRANLGIVLQQPFCRRKRSTTPLSAAKMTRRGEDRSEPTRHRQLCAAMRTAQHRCKSAVTSARL